MHIIDRYIHTHTYIHTYIHAYIQVYIHNGYYCSIHMHLILYEILVNKYKSH
jgi:hypothetical protein